MRRKSIIVITLMLMALCFCLTGCNSYTSHGTGTLIVQNNVSNKAEVAFHSLDGTRVYKMKVKDSKEVLKYSGKLDKGNVTVYYDNDGAKKELFSVSAGENVDSSFEALEKGTLYIILKTDGEAEGGNFSFSLE